MELISIVLPIYNVSTYLERCLKSICTQTYSNIEIILVDDGSTDNSGEICDAYAARDNRIVVVHKKNGGLSDARNAGIKIAKGKYISFVDSDDYVDCDYIEFLYNTLKSANAKMSICSHKVVYENGTILEKATNEMSVLSSEKVLERILYDEGIDLSAWAKLYDIDLFKEILFPVGRLFEDAATTYKLVYKAETIAIGSVSKYYYMMRGNSITNIGFSRKKIDLIKSTKEMSDFVTQKFPNLKKAGERRLMYAYLSTLSQLANSSTVDKEVESELMCYIKKKGNQVLFDKRSKNRDKVAILSTKFGFGFYKFIWHQYKILTGRI